MQDLVTFRSHASKSRVWKHLQQVLLCVFRLVVGGSSMFPPHAMHPPLLSSSCLFAQSFQGYSKWPSSWRHIVDLLCFAAPQAMSRTKRLDDELELSALLNLGSKRGSGNEIAARLKHVALNSALGNRRLDQATLSTLSGGISAQASPSW